MSPGLGSSRSRVTIARLVVLALIVVPLNVGLAQVAPANHGTRTLELIPEVATRLEGDLHTVTATLYVAGSLMRGSTSPPSPGQPINIDFEIEGGPSGTTTNNPGNIGTSTTVTSDTSRTSPDMTCTIQFPSTSCVVSFQSDGTGTNLVRGWIDDDGNASFEGDGTEGRLSSNTTDCETTTDTNCVGVAVPGSKAEMDDTDVIQIQWNPNPGPATFLDCTPDEPAVNPSAGTGSTEQYVCTLLDAEGIPVPNKHIDGEIMNAARNGAGPNDPGDDDPRVTGTADFNPACTTGSDGACTASIASTESQAGQAHICFWGDIDGDSVYAPSSTADDGGGCLTEPVSPDDEDLIDVVAKEWQARTPSGLDAQPDDSTVPLGTPQRITGTVYDQFGSTFSGEVEVKFEFFEGSVNDGDGNDPSTPDRTCTTGGTSSCAVTVTSTSSGVDRLCVWILDTPEMTGENCDGEGLVDPSANDGTPNDPRDVVRISWSTGEAGPGPPASAKSGPDASSWDAGRLDLFAQGSDDQLIHRWYNGSWSGWEGLGGQLTADPTAVSWGTNRIDVFVRGTDGGMWHRWWDGSTWQGYEGLGGQLVGGPDAASWQAGRLDIFARGTDNALWHTWYDGTWHGWESLGGVLTSDPSAVSWGPNRIDVFARGTDNAVWQIFYNGTSWSGWSSRGGVATSAPDVSSWDSGRLDLFVRGTDNAIWHTWYDGTWHGYDSIGGAATSDPGAVSWGPNRIDLFVKGNDNAIWHAWWDGVSWKGYESLGAR